MRWLAIKLVVAASLIFAFLRYLGTRPGKMRLPFTEPWPAGSTWWRWPASPSASAPRRSPASLGLSAAFGAFLAGLVIAGSTLRAEAIAVTHPIQSLLIVVFFLSIGLLIDLDFIVANLGTVIVFVVAVLIVKTVVNVALLRLSASLGDWRSRRPDHGADRRILLRAGGDRPRQRRGRRRYLPAGHRGDRGVAAGQPAVDDLGPPLSGGRARRHLDFRAALAEVYAGEIEEIARGRLVVRGTALHRGGRRRSGCHRGDGGAARRKREPPRPAPADTVARRRRAARGKADPPIRPRLPVGTVPAPDCFERERATREEVMMRILLG